MQKVHSTNTTDRKQIILSQDLWKKQNRERVSDADHRHHSAELLASVRQLVENSDMNSLEAKLDEMMIKLSLKNSLRGKYEMPFARAMTLQSKPGSQRSNNSALASKTLIG